MPARKQLCSLLTDHFVALQRTLVAPRAEFQLADLPYPMVRKLHRLHGAICFCFVSMHMLS